QNAAIAFSGVRRERDAGRCHRPAIRIDDSAVDRNQFRPSAASGDDHRKQTKYTPPRYPVHDILHDLDSELVSEAPLPCTRGRGVGGEGEMLPPHPQPLSPEYRGEGSLWDSLSVLEVDHLAIAWTNHSPQHGIETRIRIGQRIGQQMDAA